MSGNNEFHEQSYRIHTDHYRDYSPGGEKEFHSKTWMDLDTVDAWRHKRMYQAIDPILETEPEAKWLTVGDGRYGSDAKYLLDHGGRAVATDITDILLKKANEVGYISDFHKENAEALSFSNGEFDYVLCKESFHHFPRPFIALYEMMRVAEKGVVLIEPNDCCYRDNIIKQLVAGIVKIIRTVFNNNCTHHGFEESGNYIYTISKREIEKAALGMNYGTIAFKGINDYYQYGAEFEKLSRKGKIYQKIRFRIKLLDMFTKLNLLDYGMLVVVLLKHMPSLELIKSLRRDGFEVVDLPKNPYLAKSET